MLLLSRYVHQHHGQSLLGREKGWFGMITIHQSLRRRSFVQWIESGKVGERAGTN
jgi:hypothetical protein